MAETTPSRETAKPRVITLCGSTRFPDAFALANAHLSMQGYVVIGLGLMGHADEPRGARFLTSDGDESTSEKRELDELHFRKIDLSDEVFVVNVGGYVGSSTRREIAYARQHGKRVRYLFPDDVPGDLPQDADRDEERAGWSADMTRVARDFTTAIDAALDRLEEGDPDAARDVLIPFSAEVGA